MPHWLAHLLGLDTMTSTAYAFWSAFGSVAVPLAVSGLGVGLAFWLHNRCEVHRCYRYARRTTAASERACRVHHPNPRPTVQDLHERHHAALRRHGGEPP